LITAHLDEVTLNEWLDDALPARERGDADAHLAACPHCAGRLAELRAVFIHLAALPEAPLARDLAPAVLARLPAPPKPAFGPRWRWALALQATLALGGLLLAAPAADVSPVTAAAAEIQAGWAQVLTGWWMGLSAQAQADLAAAFAAGAQFVSDARALAAPLSRWPEAAWSTGLAVLGLLWLAGNGLALRRLTPPLSQSRSR
jgi:anti-sigma factor RsiW